MLISFYKTLPDDLKKNVDRFEAENFLEDETRQEHASHMKEKYFSKPAGWLLALQDKQIIGRIILYKREVSFLKKSILIGGIGGVCTHRNMRGQGIASQLLAKTMNNFKDWRCDVALLWTDLEKHSLLYKQFGFVPLKRPYSFIGNSGALYEQNGGMIAAVNSLDLFNLVLKNDTILNLGMGNW